MLPSHLKVPSYLKVLFLPPLLPLSLPSQPISKPLLQKVINLIKVYLNKEKKFREELYNILKVKLQVFYNCGNKVKI